MTSKTHQPARNGIKRPLIPYFGSKWRIAPKIIAHFPAHETYIEPFGGGASVLLSKPPARLEIYNDLNEDLVNLFTVLRTQSGELLRALRRTPYAEAAYLGAFEPTNNPVEQARRLIVRGHMGFHSRAVFGEPCVFRLFGSHGGGSASAWASHIRSLPHIVTRLRKVTISCRPAIKLIGNANSADTLIYADPPYVTKTRRTGTKYRFEMQDEDHKEMLEALASSKAMIALSGYASPLYDKTLKGWQRVVIPTRVFSVGETHAPAEEVLWLNKALQRRRK